MILSWKVYSLRIIIVESKAYARKLLQLTEVNKAVFDDFCTSLECLKDIIVATDKVQLMTSKRTKCWSMFHKTRQEQIPHLWEDLHQQLKIDTDANHFVVVQTISQNLFEDMLQRYFTAGVAAGELNECEASLTSDELNIIRYASAFCSIQANVKIVVQKRQQV